MDTDVREKFEALMELVQQLGERMDERFEALEGHMNQRFAAVEQRLDRLENRMTALEFQMVGINRTMDQGERQMSQVLVTQGVQKKAIDDLAARVTRLEQQRSQ